MFERLTAGARAVVRDAVAHAERTGSDTIGEPELLLAVLDRRDTPAAAALDGLGVQRAALADDLAADRRRAGLSSADAAALAGLGIDVEEVIARVEETHGAGALAAGGRRGGRGKRMRRAFAPEGKAVLERALRIALGRGDRHVGDEHLLLALTARSGPAGAVLAGRGVTYEAVAGALARPPAERAG